MKMTKQIVALAILGASVLGATADPTGWTIVGPPAVVTTVNQGGTATYEFIPNADGTLVPGGNFFSYTATPPSFGANPLATYAVTSGDSGSYTSGTPFYVTISWTTVGTAGLPAGTTSTGYENFYLDTSAGFQATSQNFTVVAAPEPAQTIAGAMLLGCGGLVFASRRLFKKQSA